jgi:hypothetical protein
MIVSGVIATLVGVISLPPEWLKSAPYLESFGWVRGVPAAIVTIAAGYLSSFTYREDAVRQELAVNALWGELAKFQTGARPYDSKTPEENTSAFVNEVTRIVEMESHGWSTLAMGTREHATEPKAGPTPLKDAKEAADPLQ